jgi:hypothetical protein
VTHNNIFMVVIIIGALFGEAESEVITEVKYILSIELERNGKRTCQGNKWSWVKDITAKGR